VTLEPLEGSTPIGAMWTFAEGQAWMRKVRPKDV